MTISQIRRRIDAFKRKFAPELAIIRPQRIAKAGFRLPWAGKDRYRAFFRWELPA